MRIEKIICKVLHEAHERQIEETKVLLRDTRALLEQIADGEDQTRRHIEELKISLEADLRRLPAPALRRHGTARADRRRGVLRT